MGSDALDRSSISQSGHSTDVTSCYIPLRSSRTPLGTSRPQGALIIMRSYARGISKRKSMRARTNGFVNKIMIVQTCSPTAQKLSIDRAAEKARKEDRKASEPAGRL